MKMYTFEFHFINPETNEEDVIQFCAGDRFEAIDLFKDWATFDEKLEQIPEILRIHCVYNKADAKEYGKEYGKDYGKLS